MAAGLAAGWIGGSPRCGRVEVEYADHDRGRARRALAACWYLRFERISPVVRGFASFRGQRNWPGWWWFSRAAAEPGLLRAGAAKVGNPVAVLPVLWSQPERAGDMPWFAPRRHEVNNAALPAGEPFWVSRLAPDQAPSCTALIAEGGAVPVAQFDDPPPAGADQQARRAQANRRVGAGGPDSAACMIL